MATTLDKLVVRESTEMFDDRNILVALTEDQRVSFRLKGMKSGTISITIKELYEQLNGSPVSKEKKKSVVTTRLTPVSKDEPMISLNRLRSLNAVTPGKIEALVKLDEILVELIKETQRS